MAIAASAWALRCASPGAPSPCSDGQVAACGDQAACALVVCTPCSSAAPVCLGDRRLACVGGAWTVEACPTRCAKLPGGARCAACDPARDPAVCASDDGRTVDRCGADGERVREACGVGEVCAGGACLPCPGRALADRPASWRRLETRGAPNSRYEVAVAYHDGLHATAVFGGSRANHEHTGKPVSELWLLGRDDVWREESAVGAPCPRSAAAMIYDPTLDRLVLFGGLAGSQPPDPHNPDDPCNPDPQRNRDPFETLGDTFTWGATSGWSAVCESCGAPPRYAAGFAYVPELGRGYLFGGTDFYTATGFADLYTWTSSTKRWTLVSPTGDRPRPMFSRTVAYDAEHRALVALGGYDGIAASADVALYLLSPSDRWLRAASLGPGQRVRPALAYDPERRVLVAFGGERASMPLDDTWIFDGVCWLDVSGPERPNAGRWPRAVYDPDRRAVVLVGSSDGDPAGLTDVWVW